MRSGRPKTELILSDDEREQLHRWSRRPKTAQALAQRARIVLACADGRSNDEVARQLKITPQTVGKCRQLETAIKTTCASTTKILVLSSGTRRPTRSFESVGRFCQRISDSAH